LWYTNSWFSFGGSPTPGSNTGATEEYDGSSWANNPTGLNTARFLTGAGTQTAGLAFGGTNPPATNTQTATEEYDGSTWARWKFKHSKKIISRSRNSNSSFSFWWS
jgi:hypothetical protein